MRRFAWRVQAVLRSWTGSALGILVLCGAASAEYGFGKNKITYGARDWYAIDVGSCRLYFPEGFEKVGQMAAREVEQSAALIEDILGIQSDHEIPIVVYGSHMAFLETRILPQILPEGVGGFTEFIQGRVVVPNTGAYGELRHVLVHELTHALMLDKLARVSRINRRMRLPSVPLWFTEGLAEYTSTTWTAQEEMVMGDAFIDGYLPDLANLWKLNGSYLLYCAGHSVLLFMSETYGPGVIRCIIDELGDSASFEEALERAVGIDQRAVGDAWKHWLGGRFAYAYGLDEASVRFARALPTHQAFLSPSPWGDSADTLVSLSYGDGYSSVYSACADPSLCRPKRIVQAGGREGAESLHLFRSRLGVSPSGIVAFVAKSGDRDALCLADGRSGRVLRRWRSSGLLTMASPSFAPCESLLAFSAMDTSGVVDLYVLDLRSDSLCRLTADVFDDGSPVFSPDGTSLVFHSDRSPCGPQRCSNLYLLDLPSGQITQLTCGPFRDRDPAWSPTGEGITFVSDRGQGIGLWEVSGTKLRPLVLVKGGAFDPSWSRDGERLYFATYRHGTHEVFVAERSAISGAWEETDPRACGGFWQEPDFQTLPRIRRYTPRFNLDVAGGILTYDPTLTGGGGANIVLSDVLGEKRIYAHVSNGAETAGDFLSSFNLAVAYANLRPRLAHSLGVFRLAVSDRTSLEDIGADERHNGAALFLSYPFSRYHRIDAGTSVRMVEELIGGSQRTELYTEIGYARDTAVWGYEGPWDGSRVSVKLESALDAGSGAFVRRDLFADARYYVRLSRTCTLANRIQWWQSGGADPRRFGLGGTFSLRGWDGYRMLGRTRLLGNIELRFPVLLGIQLFTPAGEMGLGPLRGALFFDVGRAWDGQFPGLVGSVGGGLRLTLGGFLVIRFDIAARTDFSSAPGKPGTQFFFGWSY
ncbi:MAG: BamA/TamA family outer membrane protein [Candidatus Eisenbacteria bacterium]|nr:BamA/TamA family outer membrane protein [Candidatus Eisenbacteria bacterium]